MELPNIVDENIEKLDIPAALEAIIELFRRCNKYIDETMPWVIAKDDDKTRLETVIYNLLACIKHGAVALKPFLPTTAESIFEQLNISDENVSEFATLESGKKINEAKPLFMRIDKTL